MHEKKLRLVKTQKSGLKRGHRGSGKQVQPAQILQLVTSDPQPRLTPAEQAEAARFRALTSARAARQARIHRMMLELQELDEASPAA